MNWKEYPDELIKGRESAEATFIFCLWKQPDLYDDFPRVNAADDETLKTEDGIFYFSLGRQMFNQGFRSLVIIFYCNECYNGGKNNGKTR